MNCLSGNLTPNANGSPISLYNTVEIFVPAGAPDFSMIPCSSSDLLSLAIDEKMSRKDETWAIAVDKAITDQSDSIDKVNRISESILKRGEELAELTKFARETEILLEEQSRRMNFLIQIVGEISNSADGSFEKINNSYEELIGEVNQASIEISETSESASGVREWIEQS